MNRPNNEIFKLRGYTRPAWHCHVFLIVHRFYPIQTWDLTPTNLSLLKVNLVALLELATNSSSVVQSYICNCRCSNLHFFSELSEDFSCVFAKKPWNEQLTKQPLAVLELSVISHDLHPQRRLKCFGFQVSSKWNTRADESNSSVKSFLWL